MNLAGITYSKAPDTDRMPRCHEGYYVFLDGVRIGQVARYLGGQGKGWRVFSHVPTAFGFQGERSTRDRAANLLRLQALVAAEVK